MFTKKTLLFTAFITLPLSILSSSTEIPVDICATTIAHLQRIAQVAQQHGFQVAQSEAPEQATTATTTSLVPATNNLYITLLVPSAALDNGAFQAFRREVDLSRTTQPATPANLADVQPTPAPTRAIMSAFTHAARPILPTSPIIARTDAAPTESATATTRHLPLRGHAAAAAAESIDTSVTSLQIFGDETISNLWGNNNTNPKN